MDGLGEVRNILFLLTKRLESVDKKLSEVSIVANQAKERSNLANQLIFNQKNTQQIDYEIQLIRKLFGGSGPTLGDMIPIPDEVCDPDDNLLGILLDIYSTSEDRFLAVPSKDVSEITVDGATVSD
jgi:hypothetical protein